MYLLDSKRNRLEQGDYFRYSPTKFEKNKTYYYIKEIKPYSIGANKLKKIEVTLVSMKSGHKFKILNKLGDMIDPDIYKVDKEEVILEAI